MRDARPTYDDHLDSIAQLTAVAFGLVYFSVHLRFNKRVGTRKKITKKYFALHVLLSETLFSFD